MERLRHIREQAGYSQQELADESGVSQHTISEIELGRRKPQGRTLRKLAKALDVEVADLRGGPNHPLAKAPPSQQLTLNGALEEERRAVWEAAVEEARRVRETGWAQMWKALSGWRASRERAEPYAARREYLDEMGKILEKVFDADRALGWAYLQAASSTPGGSDASGPSYLREESRTTSQFYGELLGLVKSAGLGVRMGEDAAAAKRTAKGELKPPLGVEEKLGA